MKIDIPVLLENFPGDDGIIRGFLEKYKDIEFTDKEHMLEEYEKYFESLGLTYIEDIVV